MKAHDVHVGGCHVHRDASDPPPAESPDMTAPPRTLAGQTWSVLYPGAGPAYVQINQPKPCITILVHGVNDMAAVYADIERGLCEGLTERLDHLTNAQGNINTAGLIPATYSNPTAQDHLDPLPDKVYYRRQPNSGPAGTAPRSVVIPFYWGFREEAGFDPNTKKDYVQKDAPHGEWLDRFGNRLDKAGTMEGGMFANATTTLPDMWGRGFNGMLFGFIPMNALVGSPRHPLFSAPPRNYMVLAARRLAMLVAMIRAKHPDDTVNLVAHSQGTMLSLLANAFLKDDGQRPIDGAVLMNSPYSLVEPAMERTQVHSAQQTERARKQTLAAIVDFIGAQPHPTPSMADMANAESRACIGGLRWLGSSCTTTFDQAHTVFDERDNRGNVTLYFTPLDQTVGLKNVQGIGWQGVPDTLLGGLGPRFHQRVFSIRTRRDRTTDQVVSEQVGASDLTYSYVLRERGEDTWDGNGQGWTGNAVRAELKVGQAVTINAPRLPRPLTVDFDQGGTPDERGARHGIHMVKAPMDPIDASIGITNGGWKTNDFRHGYTDIVPYTPGQSLAEVQAAYNKDKDIANQATVRSVSALGDGTARIQHSETPYQARQRLMETPADRLTKNDALSFHSAIPGNPEHSRMAVAYDLAIGQARSIDDEAFYAYLCRVADWRLGWGTEPDSGFRPNAALDGSGSTKATEDSPDASARDFYLLEDAKHRALIDATEAYHTLGQPGVETSAYKQYFAPPLPTLVTSETREEARG
jgi:pimeloyl-ACP methyl ester carboxylesterase